MCLYCTHTIYNYSVNKECRKVGSNTCVKYKCKNCINYRVELLCGLISSAHKNNRELWGSSLSP